MGLKDKRNYEGAREYSRRYSREKVAATQDISPLPDVSDSKRKNVCEKSLKKFCEVYFPDIFTLPWSEDHLKVFRLTEQAVENGDLFGMAMPRGSGKTSISLCSVLWAAVYGKAPFIVLIASSADRADNILNNIKIILETNPKLAEDFPEVCYPIACLERVATRARGQRIGKEPTRIIWTQRKIVLPTVAGSKASGIVISTAGMASSDIRGLSAVRPDGAIVRPGLVFIDDPQTSASANSPSQCRRRLDILAADILGIAGPGKKIAGIMTCTVTRKGDVADEILDRKKHPEWHGTRCPMVYRFPEDEKLWEEYALIRADSFRADGNGKEATDFYRKNRMAMDKGARVAWPERFNTDEISAVQHAMNLRFRDESAFWSEYQNNPLDPAELDSPILSVEEIVGKVNPLRRGVVPFGAEFLTAFIDVHQEALYWMVCSWERNFTGSVIDYGTFPSQRTEYFQLRTLKATLSSLYRGSTEAVLYAAISDTLKDISEKSYRREDGQEVHLALLLADANWGAYTDVVYKAMADSDNRRIFLPYHGKFVGAASQPFAEYHRAKYDRIGFHWRIPDMAGKRPIRHVLSDVNYWKSFVHQRISTPVGENGALTFFGKNGKKNARHELLAEHLTSESPVRVSAKERTVDEWKQNVKGSDNHWFDCLVGCAVGASINGATMEAVGRTARPADRPKQSFREIQQNARAKRGRW